jgi:hypothetical protein
MLSMHASGPPTRGNEEPRKLCAYGILWVVAAAVAAASRPEMHWP